jgi:hypothetical protein
VVAIPDYFCLSPLETDKFARVFKRHPRAREPERASVSFLVELCIDEFQAMARGGDEYADVAVLDFDGDLFIAGSDCLKRQGIFRIGTRQREYYAGYCPRLLF